ncbi:MAG: hypothetical protein N2690_10245, partial [Rhodocyclaceae bacterium]|nr:hypothetical protein [Rhodocyclaceae bacterium]
DLDTGMVTTPGSVIVDLKVRDPKTGEVRSVWTNRPERTEQEWRERGYEIIDRKETRIDPIKRRYQARPDSPIAQQAQEIIAQRNQEIAAHMEKERELEELIREARKQRLKQATPAGKAEAAAAKAAEAKADTAVSTAELEQEKQKAERIQLAARERLLKAAERVLTGAEDLNAYERSLAESLLGEDVPANIRFAAYEAVSRDDYEALQQAIAKGDAARRARQSLSSGGAYELLLPVEIRDKALDRIDAGEDPNEVIREAKAEAEQLYSLLERMLQSNDPSQVEAARRRINEDETLKKRLGPLAAERAPGWHEESAIEDAAAVVANLVDEVSMWRDTPEITVEMLAKNPDALRKIRAAARTAASNLPPTTGRKAIGQLLERSLRSRGVRPEVASAIVAHALGEQYFPSAGGAQKALLENLTATLQEHGYQPETAKNIAEALLGG